MEEISAVECEYVGGAGGQPTRTSILPMPNGDYQVRRLSPGVDASGCYIFDLVR